MRLWGDLRCKLRRSRGKVCNLRHFLSNKRFVNRFCRIRKLGALLKLQKKKQKNCSATDVNMNLHNILGFSDQNIIPRSNIASKFIHNCKNYVKLFQLYSNLLPYSDSQINQPAIHNFFKLKIIAKKSFLIYRYNLTK